MYNETVIVTPDLAKYWLTKSTVNRKLNKASVLAFSEQMKIGNWRLSTQGIEFGISGRLLNGHHRLHAVIKADIPISFVVWKDVDDNLFDVFDTGVNRTAGDVLNMEGVHNYNNIAACITMHSNFIRGIFYKTGGRNRKTNHEVLEIYKVRPDFWQRIVNEAQVLYKHGLQVVRPAIIASLLAYWEDKNQSSEFIKAVFTDGDVINAKALNRFFVNAKIRNRNLPVSDVIDLFFKYHNFFIIGKKASVVSVNSNEIINKF